MMLFFQRYTKSLEIETDKDCRQNQTWQEANKEKIHIVSCESGSGSVSSSSTVSNCLFVAVEVLSSLLKVCLRNRIGTEAE